MLWRSPASSIWRKSSCPTCSLPCDIMQAKWWPCTTDTPTFFPDWVLVNRCTSRILPPGTSHHKLSQWEFATCNGRWGTAGQTGAQRHLCAQFSHGYHWNKLWRLRIWLLSFQRTLVLSVSEETRSPTCRWLSATRPLNSVWQQCLLLWLLG